MDYESEKTENAPVFEDILVDIWLVTVAMLLKTARRNAQCSTKGLCRLKKMSLGKSEIQNADFEYKNNSTFECKTQL